MMGQGRSTEAKVLEEMHALKMEGIDGYVVEITLHFEEDEESETLLATQKWGVPAVYRTSRAAWDAVHRPEKPVFDILDGRQYQSFTPNVRNVGDIEPGSDSATLFYLLDSGQIEVLRKSGANSP